MLINPAASAVELRAGEAKSDFWHMGLFHHPARAIVASENPGMPGGDHSGCPMI
jgi:hypothetical protein